MNNNEKQLNCKSMSSLQQVLTNLENELVSGNLTETRKGEILEEIEIIKQDILSLIITH